MRADVDRQVVASRARRVEDTSVVEIQGNGIDDQSVGRPRDDLESRCDLDGDAAAGRSGETVGLDWRQAHDSTALSSLCSRQRPFTTQGHYRSEEADIQQAPPPRLTHAG